LTTRPRPDPTALAAPDRHRLLPSLIVLISAAAWVLVWRFGESPWGHWGHRTAHDHGGSGGSTALLAATFVGGWVVMTAAMMLPTTLPLVGVFERVASRRSDRHLLVSLVVTGFLLAWAACGAVVFAATRLLQSSAGTLGWPGDPRMATAALFLVAGLFQFSRLKYRCLDQCRSPMSFVTSRWHGRRERWQSFRIGIDHGVYCVGCCWALMLLMFAASAASVVWMLVLGAVMAIEKNMPWGRRLSAPVGVALLAAGAAMVLLPG
jgi:predicted metal-binding membrane protein